MHVIDDGDDLPVPEPGTGDGIGQRPTDGGVVAEDLAVTLALEDLLPDRNGEIVIVGTGGSARLSIVTDQRICESGVAEDHVTADGYEVGGLAYYAFESGMRVYFSPDLELTIAPAQG